MTTSDAVDLHPYYIRTPMPINHDNHPYSIHRTRTKIADADPIQKLKISKRVLPPDAIK